MKRRHQHIDTVLSTRIAPLLSEASDVINSLKVGEKIPATSLAKLIAERHGLTGPSFYPILKVMFANYPGVVISAGAQGGIKKIDDSADEEV
jgi:hypothetical protein